MPAETLRTDPRVLVADDDQSIRQLLCTIVNRENLKVDCAPDGVHAVEMLEQHSYSLILLDLMMPRLDGFGVIEYLKTHPPLQKPIVLVITAYADQKFKDVDPEIVSGVLRKPFEVAELGGLIQSCVDGFENAKKTVGSRRPAVEGGPEASRAPATGSDTHRPKIA